MILPSEIVKQILSGKRTMVRVPTSYPKPCEGHVYAVKTAQRAPIACHITVTRVKEGWIDDAEYMDQSLPVWEIRFKKGDHTDKPRLLAARWQPGQGDYTDTPARALSGAAEEVSAQTQGMYANESQEGLSGARNGQWRQDRDRLLKAVQGIRLEVARNGLGSGDARRRLKRIEHELRCLRAI